SAAWEYQTADGARATKAKNHSSPLMSALTPNAFRARYAIGRPRTAYDALVRTAAAMVIAAAKNPQRDRCFTQLAKSQTAQIAKLYAAMSDMNERPQKMVNGIKIYIQTEKKAVRLLTVVSTKKNSGGTESKKKITEIVRPIASCSPNN